MVLYDYFCNADHPHEGCGYEWEEGVDSIEDRCKPMDLPCPKCNKVGNICRKISGTLPIDPNLISGNKKLKNSGVYDAIERIEKSTPDGIKNWNFR